MGDDKKDSDEDAKKMANCEKKCMPEEGCKADKNKDKMMTKCYNEKEWKEMKKEKKANRDSEKQKKTKAEKQAKKKKQADNKAARQAQKEERDAKRAKREEEGKGR